MGNAIRMMKYDRAENVANAVPILNFEGTPLSWHRLDDGVMGGRSETDQDALRTASQKAAEAGCGPLVFSGRIDTNGGGFASIRAPLHAGAIPDDTDALRVTFRGDGKTYKVLLSDGTGGGPMSSSPSWQSDLPTEARGPDDAVEEATLPLRGFLPSFGGRAALSAEERKKYSLVPSDMRQLGIMLSLKLSDGRANPPETFGVGVFDYAVEFESIEALRSNDDTAEKAASDGKTSTAAQ